MHFIEKHVEYLRMIPGTSTIVNIFHLLLTAYASFKVHRYTKGTCFHKYIKLHAVYHLVLNMPFNIAFINRVR